VDHITIPNVLSNQTGFKSRFFSGDWSCFKDEFEKKIGVKYDLILTSETIYNTGNYQKLVSTQKDVENEVIKLSESLISFQMDIFDSCLNENGIILLAAKIHYFGVGGGLRLFEKSIQVSF